MKIGQKIYELRTARNMSQGDLANVLEVSRQSVSKWETDAAVPDLDKLIKLADVFEISLDELAGRQISHETVGKGSTERKQTGITQNQIIGYILLVASLVGFILTFIFINHWMIPNITIVFTALTLVGSLLCLFVKKNLAYWMSWSVVSALGYIVFIMCPIPLLLGTIGIHAITLLVFAIVGKRFYKSREIKISKTKTRCLILGWMISVLGYMVALFMIPGPTVLWCVSIYGMYIIISLLMTYTLGYIKCAKNYK